MIDFVEDVRTIINSGPFSEVVRYCPHKGKPREIWAIIDRNPVELEPALGANIPRQRFTAEVIRAELDGITNPYYGFDLLEIFVSPSDRTRTPMKIAEAVESNDPGRLVFTIIR